MEENNQEVDRLQKLLTAQIDTLESHPHWLTELGIGIVPWPRHEDTDITIFNDLDYPNLLKLQSANTDPLQQRNEANTISLQEI